MRCYMNSLFGSSPRGRGTVLYVVDGAFDLPVHPRVGGEQFSRAIQNLRSSGSSPRGRGTGMVLGVGIPLVRFIPAWAGNRNIQMLGGIVPAVHPRVGGEQTTEKMPGVSGKGSSPRGRGTARNQSAATCQTRFIPAWAGNRWLPWLILCCPPVHPRVGGEQDEGERAILPSIGSSPRGRGTGRGPETENCFRRFIPAWAGNSELGEITSAVRAVHPRVGGEQAEQVIRAQALAGSSPRGRGTGCGVRSSRRIRRFIPAWAGNRKLMRSTSPLAMVHPRVGGEQS